MLPFVPGRGREMPVLELTLPDLSVDTGKLASYAKVCGFTLKDTLPPTYPHVLAFPLHMAVMADGRFPFGAVGLVHVENRILQRRPISIGEKLTITVWPTHIEPHPRGRTFSLLTEVSVEDEKVWESVSTMLRRGGSPSSRAEGPSSASPDTSSGNVESAGLASPDTPSGNVEGPGLASPDTPSGNVEGSGSTPPHTPSQSVEIADASLAAGAEWRLPGDLGRRYAAVSGDRNPIHMHSLTAKPLGFPQAIAHGMWTKARCLAALQARLPDGFEAVVRFRKPIALPSKVQFAASAGELPIDFEVRRSKDGALHLQGAIEPLQSNQSDPRRK